MRISPPSSHWSSATRPCGRGAGSKLLPETLLGRESASDTVVRALALQEAAEDRRVLAQPLWMASVYWWWSDAHERARDTNRASLQRARELGDESSAPYVLILLGFVEATIGDSKPP